MSAASMKAAYIADQLIGTGLRFLRGRQAIQGAYLTDINAMVSWLPLALVLLAAAGFADGIGPSP